MSKYYWAVVSQYTQINTHLKTKSFLQLKLEADAIVGPVLKPA